MELVATVIHELAHNTLYVKSQTPFNESFASFVGYRGAEAFFRARGDTLDAKRAAARWRDERTLDVLWSELARRLDSAYAGALGGPALERARATLFGWARGELTGAVGQGLETYDWRWFADAPLNNAVVIAQRLYRMNLNLFDAVYLQNNADLAETIGAIQVRVFTKPDRDPYKALYSRPGVPGEDWGRSGGLRNGGQAVKLRWRRSGGELVVRADIGYRCAASGEPLSLLVMPYERFREWQACDQLVLAVYRTTTGFPRHELYGLTSQAGRAPFSAAGKIAEVSANQGRREFRRYLGI